MLKKFVGLKSANTPSLFNTHQMKKEWRIIQNISSLGPYEFIAGNMVDKPWR